MTHRQWHGRLTCAIPAMNLVAIQVLISWQILFEYGFVSFYDDLLLLLILLWKLDLGGGQAWRTCFKLLSIIVLLFMDGHLALC